jgi:aspartyl-tRNA(Asn)/glutamyl-tRNA(Gln) amidotransferase subunit A
MSELADLGVVELTEAFRDGQASPVEAVDSCLDRISRLEPILGAFLTIEADSARAEAKTSARRWMDGTARALEGVPFGLKDIIFTEGTRTTGGSAHYADHVPTRSATVARRLTGAGGIRLGKLCTFEFACGGNAATRNPWADGYWTSGSSSGSAAAVAGRELPLAVGTDTGGSIAIPSSMCGIVGVKPTYGRVSRHGVMPMAWTLDHVGPMTRSVRDAAAALSAMAGHDRNDPTSLAAPVEDYPSSLNGDVAGLRVGVPSDWFFELCHPQIASTVRAAIEQLVSAGAFAEPVSFPAFERADPHVIEVTIIAAELGSLHEANRDRLDQYGPEVSRLLTRAQFTLASDYLHALRARHLLQLDFQRAFQAVDVIVMPGVPYLVPRQDHLVADFGDRKVPLADVVSRNTAITNLIGAPSTTVPCALDDRGLPIGVQVVARPLAEAMCLRVADALERLCAFADLVPPPLRSLDTSIPADRLAGKIQRPVTTTTKDGMW